MHNCTKRYRAQGALLHACEQASRCAFGLAAQFGYGDAFPQPADAQAAYHHEIRPHFTVGIHQVAFRCRVDADAMWAGPGKALAQQVGEQRVAHQWRAHFHASGIDDAIHVQLQCTAVTGKAGDAQALAFARAIRSALAHAGVSVAA